MSIYKEGKQMNRFKAANIASILGMIGNIFLLIMKAIIGVITNSQSMIADAMNSAGDIFSSAMTFIGNKIASKPSDEDHNLGHGKAEYIYSMLISIAMMAMALQVFVSAIKALVNHIIFDFSFWLIIVCVITIIVKLALYIYTKQLSKKYNNLLMEANCKDHRNDCIVTIVNLISIIISTQGVFWLDGIAGTLISLWILFTGLKIFKESYDVLMDKSLSLKTKDLVCEIINKHKEVKEISKFHSVPIGYQYQVVLTIKVDGNLTTFESHEIANHLEKQITKEVEEIFLTVVHVDPI